MKRIIREAIGYGAASACALAVDFAALWILVHFLSWQYLTAATASFLAGAIVAYELSMKFAFKEHRLQDQRIVFAGFVAIGTLGVAVNAGVMALAISCFGLHYLLAKAIAAAFTFGCNFIARRQLLFVRRPPV